MKAKDLTVPKIETKKLLKEIILHNAYEYRAQSI